MIDLKTIEQFDPISLSEMDSVSLMNRTDTKYVLSYSELASILTEIKDDYRILEINGNRISSYQSLYFDTLELKFYFDHHNGRVDRYKARIREYIESGLFFLEVKHKYKGRTNKKRIKLDGFEEELSMESLSFVHGIMPGELKLVDTLWNSFKRITLVSKRDKERMTIDLDLAYKHGDWSFQERSLVIAEVKQERVDRNSVFMQAARRNGVRPMRLSKYCIGMARRNGGEVKCNNFKPK